MRKLYRDRLLKLAAHLENGRPGGHRYFDFSIIHQNHGSPRHCGTSGCAIGEMPVVWPRLFVFSGPGEYDEVRSKKNPIIDGFGRESYRTAVNFFGLTYEEAEHLFSPNRQDVRQYGGRLLTGGAKPESVARNIRAFVAKKEREAANA